MSIKDLIIIVLSAIVIGSAYAVHKEHSMHQAYYQAAETLLDSLELNFNWLDRYDPDEALDNYQTAKDNLHY